MPRHKVCDAHESINEICTIPYVPRDHPYRHSTEDVLDIFLSTEVAEEPFDVCDVLSLSNVLGISEDVFDGSLEDKMSYFKIIMNFSG